MNKKKHTKFGYSTDLRVIGFQLLSYFMYIIAMAVGLILYNFKLVSLIYIVFVYIVIPFMFLKYPRKVERISNYIYFLLLVSTVGAFPYYGKGKLIIFVWICIAIFGTKIKSKHNKLLREIDNNN